MIGLHVALVAQACKAVTAGLSFYTRFIASKAVSQSSIQ